MPYPAVQHKILQDIITDNVKRGFYNNLIGFLK